VLKVERVQSLTEVAHTTTHQTEVAPTAAYLAQITHYRKLINKDLSNITITQESQDLL